jgi:hypothetical protein
MHMQQTASVAICIIINRELIISDAAAATKAMCGIISRPDAEYQPPALCSNQDQFVWGQKRQWQYAVMQTCFVQQAKQLLQ